MRQSEVLGTAIGVEENGIPNLTVFVDRDAKNMASVVSSLPRQVNNVPVHIEMTDKFRSAIGKVGVDAAKRVSHTAKQTK